MRTTAIFKNTLRMQSWLSVFDTALSWNMLAHLDERASEVASQLYSSSLYRQFGRQHCRAAIRTCRRIVVLEALCYRNVAQREDGSATKDASTQHLYESEASSPLHASVMLWSQK